MERPVAPKRGVFPKHSRLTASIGFIGHGLHGSTTRAVEAVGSFLCTLLVHWICLSMSNYPCSTLCSKKADLTRHLSLLWDEGRVHYGGRWPSKALERRTLDLK